MASSSNATKILGNVITGTTGTTSTNLVYSTSPTLINPALGTPSALVGTNITGTAAGLSIGGNAATATTATTTTTTTNIAGGLGGQIPYQSAVNTTALLANGSSGQVLTSAGTTLAPTWTTPTVGTVTAVSIATSAGISGSSSGGATPALTITLGALTGVTSLNGLVITANNATITTGIWNGTTIAIANGGTGQTTAGAAFNALSPMTTGGDLIYGGASGAGTRLANGSAGQVLTSAGTTLAPTWATPTTGTVTAVSIATANGFSGSSSGGATPALTIVAGAITPTSVNGNVFTTGSSTYTGTAGQTYTFPTTTATIARTDAANTFSGTQTITTLAGIATITGTTGNMTITSGTGNSRTMILQTTTSGGTATTFLTGNADQTITFAGAASGVSFATTAASPLLLTNGKLVTIALTSQTVNPTTLTIPNFASVSDTFAFITLAQTLSNKTLASPVATTAMTTSSSTFALLNTTATTVNAFGATTTLNIGASATCILNFGGSTTASEFRFLEPSASGTNYSAFKAVAQGANITYSLPPTVSAAHGFLNDVAGNGVLTWVLAVIGPGSATDNAITRFDATTGSLVQNSLATINDSGGLVAAGYASTVVLTDVTYAVTATDSIILGDTFATVGFTVNLPTAVGIAGRMYTVKDHGGNAASEAITLDGAGAETIDGTATKVINSAYGEYTVISNGTNWNVVSKITAAGAGDMLTSTYDPASISQQLVGLTATQTLSNKTFVTIVSPDLHTIDGDSGTNLTITAGNGVSSGIAGGVLQMFSGSGIGSGIGGEFGIEAGDGGDTGNGGAITILSGRGGATSGASGPINITVQTPLGADSNGGNITITSGNKTGAGVSGDIYIESKAEFTLAYANGRLKLFDATAAANANLYTTNLTGDQSYYFPNTSGNIPIATGTDRVTAQTATVALATYTVPAVDSTFIVSANVKVTTATLHNFTVIVSYTDEDNVARTSTLPFAVLAGTFITAITNAGGTVPYEGIPIHIRAKASTTIIVSTVGTFTTVTYNLEERIIAC